MAKKKTAGQHLDHAIEKTKQRAGHHAKKAHEHVMKASKKVCEHPLSTKIRWALLIAILIVILIAFWPEGGEKATTAQAQSIAKMLAEENVPIRNIQVEKNGYVITYAAEDANRQVRRRIDP
jgi:hypothetical protein